LQIAALAFEIIERVGAEHTVRGKEFIELYARCESEHPAQLGPAEMPLAELIECQRFKYPALDLAAGADETGQLVGNANSNLGVPPAPGSGMLSSIFCSPTQPSPIKREGFVSVSIRSPKRFSRVNNLPQPAQLTSLAVNIP
jgi:hypothetical protein